MAWQEILKASDFLEKLEPKQKKKIKKLLQSTQPNEYMGQEMTKLEDLIKELEELDVVKSDKLLTKKVKSFSEKNLDILASAAELRKDYETLYGQIRSVAYPKGEKKK
jgi:glutamate mutase epsilon subunit|tara:strand:- start:6582 stop:6905 length:324 start_codon:yes stop_codon:yes gene_type:complete